MKNQNNIGALIPIRLDSTRLPQKALINICGKPVLYHLLDRVINSKYLTNERVIICTTNKSSDDILVKRCEEYGVNIFRGSENDLIKRLHNAMQQYRLDYVTADTLYMDLTMEKLLSDPKLDVVYASGLPLGVSSKSFSSIGMKKVLSKYRSFYNDTGFGSYFTDTDICNKAVINPVSNNHIDNEIRLTLDYEEDLQLFKEIFKRLYIEGKIFDIGDIINLVKSEPKLKEINLFLNDEYLKRWTSKRKISYLDNEGDIRQL